MKIIRKSCFVATDFMREIIQRLLHTGINHLRRRKGHEDSEVEGVEVYLTLSLTSALDMVCDQRPHQYRSLDRPARTINLINLYSYYCTCSSTW